MLPGVWTAIKLHITGFYCRFPFDIIRVGVINFIINGIPGSNGPARIVDLKFQTGYQYQLATARLKQ